MVKHPEFGIKRPACNVCLHLLVSRFLEVCNTVPDLVSSGTTWLLDTNKVFARRFLIEILALSFPLRALIRIFTHHKGQLIQL